MRVPGLTTRTPKALAKGYRIVHRSEGRFGRRWVGRFPRKSRLSPVRGSTGSPRTSYGSLGLPDSVIPAEAGVQSGRTSGRFRSPNARAHAFE